MSNKNCYALNKIAEEFNRAIGETRLSVHYANGKGYYIHDYGYNSRVYLHNIQRINYYKSYVNNYYDTVVFTFEESNKADPYESLLTRLKEILTEDEYLFITNKYSFESRIRDKVDSYNDSELSGHYRAFVHNKKEDIYDELW